MATDLSCRFFSFFFFCVFLLDSNSKSKSKSYDSYSDHSYPYSVLS